MKCKATEAKKLADHFRGACSNRGAGFDARHTPFLLILFYFIFLIIIDFQLLLRGGRQAAASSRKT